MTPTFHFVAGACALVIALGASNIYASTWNLSTVGAHKAYRLGHTGSGVLVGVSDTGIDPDHPAFGGRIDSRSRSSRDIAFGRMTDTDGHGTHVAGTIAGARHVGPTHGIAPNASLLALNSLGNKNLNTNEALHFAAKAGVKVLNGSYGPAAFPPKYLKDRRTGIRRHNPYYEILSHQVLLYSTRSDTPSTSTSAQALQAAANADVLMVFAAGNEMGEQPVSSRNPSGSGLIPLIRPENHGSGAYRFADVDHPDFHYDNPKTHRFVPGSAPGMDRVDYSPLQGALIAVVATDNANTIAPYSNHCGDTALWCLAAPGGARDASGKLTADSGILSAIPGGGFGVKQGTSMAAPLVSGAAAIMRGAFPYLSARQTIEIMLTTTNRSGHLADSRIYGRGLLDLGRAIHGPGEFGAEGYAQVFDVDTQGYDSTWSGDIAGTGGLIKRGAGALSMTGSNSYRGSTYVAGGRLNVDGLTTTSHFYVAPIATLGGSGAVGPTTLEGTIEPGELNETLTVAGDYTQSHTATFAARIGPDGQSNQLKVDGAAKLGGGTLQVYGIAPSTLGRDYTLIRTQNGISGRFATIPNDYLFIVLATRIAPDFAVGQRYALSVSRNTGGFGVVAQNGNQHAVAQALDKVAAGSPVFDALLMSRDVPTARTALTQLSGDIHPSVLGSLMQHSRLTHGAVMRQMRRADESSPWARARAPATARAQGLWAQHVSDWGRAQGASGAAPVRTAYRGMLFGGDTHAGTATRLGIAVGFGNTTLDARQRMARAKLDNYSLSAFGSTDWGATQWRYGLTKGWHHVDSRRYVAIADAGQIRTRYAARTTQLFTELGLRQRVAQHTIEPFAGLTYSAAQASRFSEPGPAGLRARRAMHDAWFTTLGARLDTLWDFRQHGMLSVQAMAGWRHALGGLTPKTTMQLPGSPGFKIRGVGMARNAVLLEAGLQWQPRPQVSLAAGYTAQLALGAQNHGLQANASWRF
ncbi:MAG: autotransporter domain-containing protein [Burkholderiaceae bacterium]|nr:autotransporter domain-containing protein [Burkholderiaceae bacterium]